MPRIEKPVIIKNPQGLHARPAALFVQIASKYNSSINIRKGEDKVNGKSIMGILTLGAYENSTIILEAEGDDADELIRELECLLSKKAE
ncbi:MAG: HPr family phosphocarrier protein [Candidatus Omnitrophica bacterium]|nr:HPr family phosphocarrier protein [Candidatus Omnitrophota bacterium]